MYLVHVYAAVEVTVGDNVANAAQFDVSGRAEEAGGGQVCIRAAGGHCGHVVNTTTVTTVRSEQKNSRTVRTDTTVTVRTLRCGVSFPRPHRV